MAKPVTKFVAALVAVFAIGFGVNEAYAWPPEGLCNWSPGLCFDDGCMFFCRQAGFGHGDCKLYTYTDGQSWLESCQCECLIET